jgi:hypothetical protein
MSYEDRMGILYGYDFFDEPRWGVHLAWPGASEFELELSESFWLVPNTFDPEE